MAEYYRRAYRERLKAMNEQLWLAGVYNHAAFNVTLGNALRKRGAPAQKYIDPLEIVPKTRAEKKAAEAKEWARIDAQLRRMAKKQRAAKQSTNKGGA